METQFLTNQPGYFLRPVGFLKTNVHVFQLITLVEAAKAKKLISDLPSHPSRPSCTLLFSPGLGIVPGQSNYPKVITVAPRYNEPRYNEDPVITKNI